MSEKKITLYLLDNLKMIIGKDNGNGKVIDEACEILQTFTGPGEYGITLEKRRLSIVAVKEVSDKLAPFYKMFIEGKRPMPPKIMTLNKN